MTFTIEQIEENDTTVTFTFNNGSVSTQTIANLPVEDKNALTTALTDYAKAYLKGLEIIMKKEIAPGILKKTIKVGS